jgi:hypothetical protein
MSDFTSGAALNQPRGNWASNALAWLDQYGRKAWIALMVLSFIFAGPLGLVVLAFMLGTGRFKRSSYPRSAQSTGCTFRTRHATHHISRASGNLAFDAYKADTIARLEREQAEFESFLIRLRESRDKAEFDQYLEQRAKEASAEGHDDGASGQDPDHPSRGSY